MKSILIVDDEQDVKSLFRQKLRKEIRDGSVSLHFAFSGEEAVSYLETGGIDNTDLILSDITMPGMSGIDLFHSIKERFPKPPKFFVITGYDDADNKKRTEEMGCAGYITKPIDFEALKQLISQT